MWAAVEVASMACAAPTSGATGEGSAAPAPLSALARHWRFRPGGHGGGEACRLGAVQCHGCLPASPRSRRYEEKAGAWRGPVLGQGLRVPADLGGAHLQGVGGMAPGVGCGTSARSCVSAAGGLWQTGVRGPTGSSSGCIHARRMRASEAAKGHGGAAGDRRTGTAPRPAAGWCPSASSARN